MAKITFVLGGTRSGKSEYAEKLAKEASDKVAYIATCVCNDDEMTQRIKLHKNRRPDSWQTFEAPYDLVPVLNEVSSKTVLIDCLTLFISNLMLESYTDGAVKNKIDGMIKAIRDNNLHAIIVSNEVGLGIVPESALGRKFRDIAGKMNQFVAGEADNVYFVVSGIPMKVK